MAPLLLFGGRVHSAPPLQPAVEAEEDVYAFEPADNGAGPLWCSGSTCLVRSGTNAFASGLETLKDLKPLNNCRWLLFQRAGDGWQLAQADASGRTREPCPLAAFAGGSLFLSVIFYVQGTRSEGKAVSENRVLEMLPDGEPGPAVPIPFKRPFTSFFTATVRDGSPPASTLDLLGQRSGAPLAISYARVRLW